MTLTPLPKFTTISLTAICDIIITSRASLDYDFRGHLIITPSLGPVAGQMCQQLHHAISTYVVFAISQKMKTLNLKFNFLFQDRFVSTGSVSSVEEDLIIYRLPGDKLGLGLRFDGGAKASEFVQRLFVQGPFSIKALTHLYFCTFRLHHFLAKLSYAFKETCAQWLDSNININKK